ncbi:MAG TPA: cob(I)yrinic acid a,c-diamide adenosyltransferase [Armatimonadota bacterium]|jgi:cob(I)alamin adenosyltransferase
MIYTGHGDAGYTSVIGGAALLKCDRRLETLGDIDEAQAQLGLTRALLADTPWAANLHRVQADLRLLMADIATPSGTHQYCQHLTKQPLLFLEEDLAIWDGMTGGFAGLTTPGNSIAGAHLHLARTVIRRAERHFVALQQEDGVGNPLAMTYLNRLSSWVYALALIVDAVPVTSSVSAAA